MTARQHTAMDAEFDDVAGWTAEAVQRLGADHAVPAACRGSASPAALDWLARVCELGEGTPLIDVGGGMGGPAAYAAAVFGARPVVVEPLRGACRAARRLFPALSVVQAAGERVPAGTGSAGAVWCLGVLCTLQDKAPVLAELRRLVAPGGHVGLMVLVAARPGLRDVPEGNSFPTRRELVELLGGAGLEIVDELAAGGLPKPRPFWRDRMGRVEASIAVSHREDPRLEQARSQEEIMRRLLASGDVEAVLLHTTTTPTVPGATRR